mmetsp:Transcript_29235/g.69409  ORF Transcript_29235/g.69409 Transcript_29235/m.69409 type:complete len:201 (+) Transcript_29235:416-1018(+)
MRGGSVESGGGVGVLAEEEQRVRSTGARTRERARGFLHSGLRCASALRQPAARTLSRLTRSTWAGPLGIVGAACLMTRAAAPRSSMQEMDSSGDSRHATASVRWQRPSEGWRHPRARWPGPAAAAAAPAQRPRRRGTRTEGGAVRAVRTHAHPRLRSVCSQQCNRCCGARGKTCGLGGRQHRGWEGACGSKTSFFPVWAW